MIGESPRSNAGPGTSAGLASSPGSASAADGATPSAAQAEARLSARLQELGANAASLAHELRSPLAAMELLAGLLKERLSDPEAQRLLEDLLVEQRQVATIVDGCLGYVRAAPLRPRPTPLRALLEEAWELARLRVPFDGSLELAPGPELVAMLDARPLRTALVDVLVNALQALAEAPPAAPRIALAVDRVAGERARLEIRDNGPGIPPEVQGRIFQPFFTTRTRGSGLGLAHAHKVVSSHGGHVEVESLPTPGCCVRLLLPLRGPS